MTATRTRPTGSASPAANRQRGQATTEYALILLVAGVIALLVLGWATSGGGGGKIGRLFDTVIESVIDRADAGE